MIIRKIRQLSLCLPFLLNLSCQNSQQSSSNLLLETDDRKTTDTALLRSVHEDVNEFVNSQIEQVRWEFGSTGRDLSSRDLRDFLNRVREVTSAPVAGSGVGFNTPILSIELSKLTEIEAWALGFLDPDANEILLIKFKDSLYKNNPVGISRNGLPKRPSHVSRAVADHSIAPVIKLEENILGIDKLAHFFEQGHWYYDTELIGKLTGPEQRRTFGYFMEGHPKLNPKLERNQFHTDEIKQKHLQLSEIFAYYCSSCVININDGTGILNTFTYTNGFGYYGASSTGVVSLADHNANEEGYSFFRDLYEDPFGFVFDIRDYNLRSMNENNGEQDNILVAGVVAEKNNQSNSEEE